MNNKKRSMGITFGRNCRGLEGNCLILEGAMHSSQICRISSQSAHKLECPAVIVLPAIESKALPLMRTTKLVSRLLNGRQDLARSRTSRCCLKISIRKKILLLPTSGNISDFLPDRYFQAAT